MKVKLRLAVILIYCISFALSACDGGGSSGGGGPVIYAGGNCKNSSNRYIPGYWKNGTWTNLENTYGDYDAEVLSFVMDGDDIIAGGYSKNNTLVVAGFWKISGGTTTWTELDNPSGNYAACVMTITVDNGTVYAGGYRTDSTGNYLAGYWTTTAGGTTSWTALTDSVLSDTAFVRGIAVSEDGDVYAAGYYFDGSNNAIACCWKNNSLNRAEFTNDYGSFGAFGFGIATDGSDVYVGGGCVTNADSHENAGYWKITTEDTTWTEHAFTNDGPWAEINVMIINGSDIYAGGFSSDATPVTIAGYWKNGTWQECANSYSSDEAYVKGMAVYGSDVYAAGYCKNGSIYTGGYWKNGAWNELTNSYGDYISTVVGIVVK